MESSSRVDRPRTGRVEAGGRAPGRTRGRSKPQMRFAFAGNSRASIGEGRAATRIAIYIFGIGDRKNGIFGISCASAASTRRSFMKYDARRVEKPQRILNHDVIRDHDTSPRAPRRLAGREARSVARNASRRSRARTTSCELLHGPDALHVEQPSRFPAFRRFLASALPPPPRSCPHRSAKRSRCPRTIARARSRTSSTS